MLQKQENSINIYKNIGKKSSLEKMKLFFFKRSIIEPKNKIRETLFNPKERGIVTHNNNKKRKELFSLFSDCMSVKTFFKKL